MRRWESRRRPRTAWTTFTGERLLLPALTLGAGSSGPVFRKGSDPDLETGFLPIVTRKERDPHLKRIKKCG